MTAAVIPPWRLWGYGGVRVLGQPGLVKAYRRALAALLRGSGQRGRGEGEGKHIQVCDGRDDLVDEGEAAGVLHGPALAGQLGHSYLESRTDLGAGSHALGSAGNAYSFAPDATFG